MKHLRKLTITGAAVIALATSAAIFRRQLPEDPAMQHRMAIGDTYQLFRQLGATAEIDHDASEEELTTVWNISWPTPANTPTGKTVTVTASVSADGQVKESMKINWPDPNPAAKEPIYRLTLRTDQAGRHSWSSDAEVLRVALSNQHTWLQMAHIFGKVGFQIRLNPQTVAGMTLLDIWWPDRPDETWQVQFGKTSDGTDFWRSDDDMVVATIADRTTYEGGACPLDAVYIAADQVIRLPDEAVLL